MASLPGNADLHRLSHHFGSFAKPRRPQGHGKTETKLAMTAIEVSPRSCSRASIRMLRAGQVVEACFRGVGGRGPTLMDVDWTRLALGAEVGLGIGALILLGWLGTRWLLRGRLGAVSWAQIAISVAIIAASTGAYAVFSYRNDPSPPAASTPPASSASDTSVPSGQALAVSPPPSRAQIDAGGVVLKFDPPEGYCLYPADLMAVVQAMHKQTNRDNVVHTAFGDCEQLRSHAESGARIRDFGIVMTPTAAVGKPFTRAALDDLAKEVIDPAQVRESVAQRMREAVSRLDLQSFSAVGVLDRD